MKKVTVGVFVVLSGIIAAWVASHDRSPAPRLPVDDMRDAGLADAALDASVDAASEAIEAETDDLSAPQGMLDAGIIGDLAEAPKSVKFGVVLIQYAGAQGAGPKMRSKADARQLAEQLAEVAKSDFAAAVEKGDPGSAKNAGRMFRRILEPGPEFALFSLAKGEVSAAVDTPRGFWVVKRLD